MVGRVLSSPLTNKVTSNHVDQKSVTSLPAAPELGPQHVLFDELERLMSPFGGIPSLEHTDSSFVRFPLLAAAFQDGRPPAASWHRSYYFLLVCKAWHSPHSLTEPCRPGVCHLV